MKILVTGGAGFIGSHVTDAYIAEGHDVVVVDDLSTGRHEFVNPKARLVQLNIFSDYAKLETLFREERFELVNHHAAQVDVRVSVANPQLDAHVNILGTLNLLKCCTQFDVRQFLFVSSGGVLYGEPDKLPATEDFPKKPLSPYGVSKLTIEYYLFSFRLNFGLHYLALRYANVYGPRQTPKSEATAVSTFSRQLLNGEMPTIFGDGTQTRDYIFIADIVRANLLATEKLFALNKSVPYQLDDLAFNIGTGREISVNEIYSQLKKQVGFVGEARYAPPRTGELLRSALSSAKAEKLLGFRAKTEFSEGLKQTIAWMRSQETSQ